MKTKSKKKKKNRDIDWSKEWNSRKEIDGKFVCSGVIGEKKKNEWVWEGEKRRKSAERRNVEERGK